MVYKNHFDFWCFWDILIRKILLNEFFRYRGKKVIPQIFLEKRFSFRSAPPEWKLSVV